MLDIGTKTQWGMVVGVGFTLGERYYWMTDKTGTAVAMMPAHIVEPVSELCHTMSDKEVPQWAKQQEPENNS